MDVQSHIIQTATAAFLQLGFKAVTVDEIARKSGISKKTLYEHYENKDALILASLEFVHSSDINAMQEIADNSDNAVEEIVKVFFLLSALIKGMNPVCFHDLGRYYPVAFQKMASYKEEYYLPTIIQNIKRGIKEGYYRSDLDIEILSRFRLESFFWMLHSDIFPRGKFNIVEVNKQIFENFVYGIATDKGHKLITKHLKSLAKAQQ